MELIPTHRDGIDSLGRGVPANELEPDVAAADMVAGSGRIPEGAQAAHPSGTSGVDTGSKLAESEDDGIVNQPVAECNRHSVPLRGPFDELGIILVVGVVEDRNEDPKGCCRMASILHDIGLTEMCPRVTDCPDTVIGSSGESNEHDAVVLQGHVSATEVAGCRGVIRGPQDRVRGDDSSLRSARDVAIDIDDDVHISRSERVIWTVVGRSRVIEGGSFDQPVCAGIGSTTDYGQAGVASSESVEVGVEEACGTVIQTNCKWAPGVQVVRGICNDEAIVEVIITCKHGSVLVLDKFSLIEVEGIAPITEAGVDAHVVGPSFESSQLLGSRRVPRPVCEHSQVRWVHCIVDIESKA